MRILVGVFKNQNTIIIAKKIIVGIVFRKNCKDELVAIETIGESMCTSPQVCENQLEAIVNLVRIANFQQLAFLGLDQQDSQFANCD